MHRHYFLPKPKMAISFLNVLINTMKSIDEYNEGKPHAERAVLDMQDYIDEKNDYNQPIEVKHFCGTAACILGYQAIVEHPEQTNSSKLERLASKNASKLIDCLGEELARSIYETHAKIRNSFAYDAGIQTHELDHLLRNDTTPQEAIEYMEFVILLCETRL
jgi:hypothetical protein